MSKFCTKCGESINEGADFCLKCGNQVTNKTQNNKKKFPVWAIILIVAVGIFTIIGVIIALTANTIDSTMNDAKSITECYNKGGIWEDNKCNLNTGNENNDDYVINKAFKFDDLEITISDDISFTTINNEFSDLNHKDIIVIPVTIKNLKDETHSLNMFFYKFYGSKGTGIDSASAYFMDESVDFGGELRAGATYTKNFYIAYDGNGDYYVEFNNFSQKIEIKIPINK